MEGRGDDLKVSIVIPTHNRCDRLSRLLSDLDRQDVSPQWYETIVIDDGSTDDTRVTVAGIRPSYRLAYSRQECGGPAAARNAGIRMARGKYVILLDDDIRVGSRFVRAHIDAHDRFHDCIVFGPCWLPAGSSTPFMRYRRALEATFAPSVGPDGTARVQAVASANLSARRALLERLGGYCEELRIPGAEEYEFLGRLVQNGVPIVYSTQVQACHEDPFVTFAAYCLKNERYAIAGAEALARYPALARQSDYAGSLVRLNAPIAWRTDSPVLIGRKVLKTILSCRAPLAVLKGFAAFLETLEVPTLTELVYRLVIGLHIFRGFRAGLIMYRVQGISG